MKNKFVFINFSMSVVLLFSIIFQSLHSYEHLSKFLTEKKCIHKKCLPTDLTHKHKILENCSVCNFTFSHVIYNDFFVIISENFNYQTSLSLSLYKQNIYFFNGIPLALRGPPYCMV
jgi:hypothetical protein